jgi:hypothetical protein
MFVYQSRIVQLPHEILDRCLSPNHRSEHFDTLRPLVTWQRRSAQIVMGYLPESNSARHAAFMSVEGTQIVKLVSGPCKTIHSVLF